MNKYRASLVVTQQSAYSIIDNVHLTSKKQMETQISEVMYFTSEYITLLGNLINELWSKQLIGRVCEWHLSKKHTEAQISEVCMRKISY